MKLSVEIDFGLVPEYEEDPTITIRKTLDQVVYKAYNQTQRSTECICTHPESDDMVRNSFGQVVGTIKVEL